MRYVIGVDFFNQQLTWSKAKTLTGQRTCIKNVPCILVSNCEESDMSYQEVTGPLMASGYSKLGTQEAMNGMYITTRGGEEMNSNWDGSQVSPTLTKNNAGGGQRMPDKENFNCVIEREPVMMSDRKGHNGITEDGTATTLNAQEKERPIVGDTAVRRLTPLECERLQGFPDGWTDIGEWTDTKGKKHKEADSPRYKALGNSIATPFWFWLMRRISAQYERPATLGSLFDGIGGFPYCWEKCNGPGTAIWASEIEEFPIAVTKKHFPEEVSK